MPTISLSVISRDYDKNIERIVNDYESFFDQFYIQINGGGKIPKSLPKKVHVSRFKWVDDFSKARNALLAKVKTDYWMWIDSDDTIVNPEKISGLVQLAESEGYDKIFLPYDYDYNPAGEVIEFLWRERIVKTKSNQRWHGPVHEILSGQIKSKDIKNGTSAKIVHTSKNQAEYLASHRRNQAILLRDYKRYPAQPRVLHYLGLSYAAAGDYETAIKYFQELTSHSEEPEYVYDAWLKIADLYNTLSQTELAIHSVVNAIMLMPDRPNGFNLLGDFYLRLDQPKLAIEWLLIGQAKPPAETFLSIDPTLNTYRPLLSLAWAYLQTGNILEAKAAIDEAAKFHPQAEAFKTVSEQIKQAYDAEQSIVAAATLAAKITSRSTAKDFTDSLPEAVRRDPRLRPVWSLAHPPRDWNSKSIVFYCGPHLAVWGPESVSYGLGGSEEAIVYLAPQLAQLGWQVTVYNQRPTAKSIKKVAWRPWPEFNPADNYNVLVAWRDPGFFLRNQVRAKVRALDMHDAPFGHYEISSGMLETIDLVLFKSQFQRNLAPMVKSVQAEVISNGISPSDFKTMGVKRQPHKVIYASSPDRGLEVLVNLWPQVLARVPDAELVWAYGWNTYDLLSAASASRRRWKWQLRRELYKHGVKELGRLGHHQLANEMKTASVWAYPTSFPEINCITAMKTQAAGVQPVTSGYGALQESVVINETNIENIHTQPDELDKYVDRLVNALKNPMPTAERGKISKQIIEQYSWPVIAMQWDKVLKQRSKL